MEGDDSLGAQPEAHVTTEREHTCLAWFLTLANLGFLGVGGVKMKA